MRGKAADRKCPLCGEVLYARLSLFERLGLFLQVNFRSTSTYTCEHRCFTFRGPRPAGLYVLPFMFLAIWLIAPGWEEKHFFFGITLIIIGLVVMGISLLCDLVFPVPDLNVKFMSAVCGFLLALVLVVRGLVGFSSLWELFVLWVLSANGPGLVFLLNRLTYRRMTERALQAVDDRPGDITS
jgi:hypothetical protein